MGALSPCARGLYSRGRSCSSSSSSLVVVVVVVVVVEVVVVVGICKNIPQKALNERFFVVVLKIGFAIVGRS